MRNLPIDCLRSFVTAAEVRGFTQAGQILGRTQPAISLQIKKLEELVGATLFIRGGARLELTPTGERLLEYADAGLDMAIVQGFMGTTDPTALDGLIEDCQATGLLS